MTFFTWVIGLIALGLAIRCEIAFYRARDEFRRVRLRTQDLERRVERDQDGQRGSWLNDQSLPVSSYGGDSSGCSGSSQTCPE